MLFAAPQKNIKDLGDAALEKEIASQDKRANLWATVTNDSFHLALLGLFAGFLSGSLAATLIILGLAAAG